MPLICLLLPTAFFLCCCFLGHPLLVLALSLALILVCRLHGPVAIIHSIFNLVKIIFPNGTGCSCFKVSDSLLLFLQFSTKLLCLLERERPNFHTKEIVIAFSKACIRSMFVFVITFFPIRLVHIILREGIVSTLLQIGKDVSSLPVANDQVTRAHFFDKSGLIREHSHFTSQYSEQVLFPLGVELQAQFVKSLQDALSGRILDDPSSFVKEIHIRGRN
mmetsp:Transcript_42332/g.128419  ORF Transcript_42332/g.128419 Transcript_42332/m.128419 type:complete len:219 (+) Transcript_42332:910-1566(+)